MISDPRHFHCIGDVRMSIDISTAIIISWILHVSAFVFVNSNYTRREAFLQQISVGSRDFTQQFDIRKHSISCTRDRTELCVIPSESFDCKHFQVELVSWPHFTDQNLVFDWPNVDFLEQRALLAFGNPLDLTGVNIVILVDDIGMSTLANLLVFPRTFNFEPEFECVKFGAFVVGVVELLVLEFSGIS